MNPHNPYANEVDEEEILDDDRRLPFGERRTCFDCAVCHKPLSEALLCDIRMAHGPIRHYECEDGTYWLNGDDVRDDDPNDKFFEATRELKLGKMRISSGGFVRYNGKSAVIRPCGYAPICDEETNHPSVQLAIRRGWLKPYVKAEEKPLNKAVCWLKSLVQNKS